MFTGTRHYFLNAGLAPHEIWFTSEGFAEALVRCKGVIVLTVSDQLPGVRAMCWMKSKSV